MPFWQSAAASGLVDILEPVSVLLNDAAQDIVAANSNVRMLDLYSLSAVSMKACLPIPRNSRRDI